MKPRPPVRALLPSLILERRLRHIPPAAVSRLARLAECQSEGRLDRSSPSCTYFGSTYFIFPLSQVRGAFAGRNVREMDAGEMARTLEAHPLLRLQLVRIAREEAERRIAADGFPHPEWVRERGAAARGPGEGRAVAPGTARVTSAISAEVDAVVIEVGLEVPCADAFGPGDSRGSVAEGRS